MSIIYLDFETQFDVKRGLTLKKMALRPYLERAPIIGVSFAVDDEPMQWVPIESEEFLPLMADIDELGQDPDTILAAFNTPFDMRVLRFGRVEAGGEPLDVRWPVRIHDAMELAMAAWPNMPGGYSLANVAKWLHLPPKLSMDDVIKGRETWEDYCNRDCLLLREIYKRAMTRLPPDEILVSEMANRIRGHSYLIHAASVDTSLAAFTANTKAGVEAALEFMSSIGRDGTDMGAELFGGYASGKVKSVRVKNLRDLLVGALGFDTTTTSLKKINPSKLAQRPDVAKLLQATSKASKGLFYQNRARALVGVREVDMELGYFRATNTGRYSAPTTGKGINKHNLSKKDKTIAKPLRQMLSLLDNMCYVRADAANVEYRVEGLLTGASFVQTLFKSDISADPYGNFAQRGFGVQATKGQPLRDVVAKAAVLGYGFCLAEGTPILTRAGWRAIETITKEDELWDGEHWIHSDGAVKTGTKNVHGLVGISMTEDHKVLCQTGWHTYAEIVSSGGTLRPLLAPNSTDGRLWVKNVKLGQNGVSLSDANVGRKLPCGSTSCGEGKAMGVSAALSREMVSEEAHQGSIPILSQIQDCEDGGGPLGRIVQSGVIIPPTLNTITTGKGVYEYDLMVAEPSLSTSSPFLDGPIGVFNLTASTTMGTTSQATSAWLLPVKICSTDAVPVWDIMNAGPNHRYQAGPLIVHNCMGRIRAAEELNKAVADPINKVSPEVIENLCRERGWRQPTSTYMKGLVTRVGCHWSIAVAADESRTAFHQLHPEFMLTADWLMRAVTMLAASPNPERLIDQLYNFPGAPDRDMIDLSIDRELEFPTVRARMLNHSMPTVTWRHLSCSHPGVDGLGAVTANKGPRNVHRSLLIENVTQAAARIMLTNAKLELNRRGWGLIDSVHDEILILCPRERNAVLKARADLLEVMSPKGPLGYKWAFYAKPSEVTITKTLYEDEKEAAICWQKLENNDPTWKEHLV